MGRSHTQLENWNTATQPGTSVDVATTSTAVVSANTSRGALILTNDSDTTIYIRYASSGATVGTGLPLAAGAHIYEDNYTGAVCARHGGSGTKSLAVIEV